MCIFGPLVNKYRGKKTVSCFCFVFVFVGEKEETFVWTGASRGLKAGDSKADDLEVAKNFADNFNCFFLSPQLYNATTL